ncbi:fatty acyl-CoA synthetase [Sporosarcina aquimarina]|uniref:Fatty acyl-CoA synthetase n=1 Tax=Sporosarcina aquimarina TaxID=114975 RepID=A0ABU4G1B0_9BACL|nr:fatty acyl-CoA synthetase [Sporosarcina aquimarina]MDW0109447.1 fatty acyl-CoA synthetase [Sporosarcina aquimarina]
MTEQLNLAEIIDSAQKVRRNTLGDLLQRTSERFPKKNALVYKNQRITYEELNALVNRTAQGLLASSLTKGDFVTVISRNSLDFVVLNFALARTGAVMVPINYMLTEEEIVYILEHAKIRAVFSSEEFQPIMDQALAHHQVDYKFVMGDCSQEVSDGWTHIHDLQKNQPFSAPDVQLDDDDVVHVLYTSGTESRPKGVMLSHKSLISEYVSSIIDGKMSDEDIVIHALPLYHSAQLHVFLGPSIYLGSRGIILEQPSPEKILQIIEEERATLLFCPPTVWIALLRHPDFDKRDLSSLKKCYYGAAIMPMEILKELKERLPGASLWNFYGQTEVAPLATALQPEDQLRKLGSAGLPSLNVQTKIVNDQDEEVPRGELGEIVHRTPHAMKGYLHDAEKTAEAFRSGWFHSGDLGIMDDEGYITIVDRKKDMINTGGVNVSSREVEEVIYEMEAVSEVAVISIPDSYWIEAVTAIIVTKESHLVTEQEVIDFCKTRLSSFKTPKHVYFAEELPKNPSGKVLKRSLRTDYTEREK